MTRAVAPAGRARADRPIDVVVVLLDRAYVSTAIGPIEVFHSAGLLWQSLRGEPTQPRFRVRTDFLRRYDVQVVGGSEHQEYWIPAEELEEFNRNIVGEIEVIAEYKGAV